MVFPPASRVYNSHVPQAKTGWWWEWPEMRLAFTPTLMFFGRTFVCGSTALLEVPATV